MLECLCEERVILLVQQVKAGSNELSVTYKCSEERCGFKIAAHNANCHAYVTILADMKEYMFYHTLDKCECGKDVHSVLERITAGTGVGDPTKERSIDLNNELQLLFICSTGQCSYRKSVPQIVITRREGICCVCQSYTVFNPKTRVFSCPVATGGCGVYFHEMDSLMYIHMEQAKSATEDCAWLTLHRKARVVCQGKPGILKYELKNQTCMVN